MVEVAVRNETTAVNVPSQSSTSEIHTVCQASSSFGKGVKSYKCGKIGNYAASHNQGYRQQQRDQPYVPLAQRRRSFQDNEYGQGMMCFECGTMGHTRKHGRSQSKGRVSIVKVEIEDHEEHSSTKAWDPCETSTYENERLHGGKTTVVGGRRRLW